MVLFPYEQNNMTTTFQSILQMYYRREPNPSGSFDWRYGYHVVMGMYHEDGRYNVLLVTTECSSIVGKFIHCYQLRDGKPWLMNFKTMDPKWNLIL